MTKVAGFSITDLLISLLLSSLVMGTLFQCYVITKRQYTKTEALLAQHFDLAWVKEMMADSIRHAGFTPCLGIEALNVVDTRAPHQKVVSLHFTNEPTGFISVNRMSETFATVVKTQGSNQLIVTKEGDFDEKRPVLIANCTHAEIHQIQSINSLPHVLVLTLTKPLLFNYDSSTYCGEWVEESWMIKTNAKGLKALYYKAQHTDELTSFIQSLNIKEQRGQQRRLIEVELGLTQGDTESLVVVVRGL